MNSKNKRLFLIKLLPTLTIWISMLILITVATISYYAYGRTKDSINFLVDKQIEALGQSTELKMENLFQSAANILLDTKTHIDQSQLDIENEILFGRYFLEKIRLRKELGWLGFGFDDVNKFIGAHRDQDHTIRYHYSNIDINDGIPMEAVMDTQGNISSRIESDTPYLVNDRPWFKAAKNSDAIVWLEPHLFADGDWGISSVLNVSGGALLADFFLSDITDFIAQKKIGKTGFVSIVTPSGEIINAKENSRNSEISSAVIKKIQSEGLYAYEFDGKIYRGTIRVIDKLNLPKWKIVISVPEEELLEVINGNNKVTLIVALFSIIFSFLLAYILSNRIGSPIRKIAEDMGKVGQFDLTDRAPPKSLVKEIAVLGESLKNMKAGLRSFSHYVPIDVVRQLLLDGDDAKLDAKKMNICIFFSDLTGFTKFSETLTPEQTVASLGVYFELIVKCLKDRKGTLDKFMGDGTLAFFGAPKTDINNAHNACRAALDCQTALQVKYKSTNNSAYPYATRIGITQGEVLVGNIGTSEQFSYTAMGDVVNLAARLESLNKFYGTKIMADETVFMSTKNEFLWRALDRVAVYGRTGSTNIYELVETKNGATNEQVKFVDQFEESLALYFDGKFDDAMHLFTCLQTEHPEDVSVNIFCERLASLTLNPPNNWTGLYSHDNK
jgi:adenylate cyclase